MRRLTRGGEWQEVHEVWNRALIQGGCFKALTRSQPTNRKSPRVFSLKIMIVINDFCIGNSKWLSQLAWNKPHCKSGSFEGAQANPNQVPCLASLLDMPSRGIQSRWGWGNQTP